MYLGKSYNMGGVGAVFIHSVLFMPITSNCLTSSLSSHVYFSTHQPEEDVYS